MVEEYEGKLIARSKGYEQEIELLPNKLYFRHGVIQFDKMNVIIERSQG